MTRPARSIRIVRLVLASPIAAALVLPAWAGNERTGAGDDTRGVHIIAAPTPAPAAAPTPPPVVEQPSPAAISPGGPPAPPPAASTPSAPALGSLPHAPSTATPAIASPPPGDAAALSPAPSSRRPALTAAELGALSTGAKLANPAEVAVEILPGPNIVLGSKVSFRVTAKKAGYLILIDVDAAGKLSQIYPNPMSLAANADRDGGNLIRPGSPFQLPNPDDRQSRFEFIALPPSGTAMLVALLSDRPVQMIDLPDVPSGLAGSVAAAELLSKAASALRLPDPKGGGASSSRVGRSMRSSMRSSDRERRDVDPHLASRSRRPGDPPGGSAVGRASGRPRRAGDRKRRLRPRNALTNPPNDASDVAESLKRLGFSVTRVVDGKYDDLRRAIRAFNVQVQGADIGLIYFAGHGMELAGENWLIPVDADLKTDLDVPNEAISLKTLMQSVSRAGGLGLVILDACRDNPFAVKMARSKLARSVARGFASVMPTSNVLVAYAAKDGTTAKDGDRRNSPYTAALLRNLEIPGLEISRLFRNVRDEVVTSTHRVQQPYVYGSLSSKAIYLRPAASPPAPSPDRRPQPRRRTTPSG